MNKLQELEKVDGERKEIVSRINLIKFHIQNAEYNLAVLKSMQIQFLENLRILKDPRYITSLHEYNKIKEELQTVNSKICFIEIEFNNYSVTLRRTQKLLFDVDEKYATLLLNQDAKIIRGNFGGKK